MNKHERIMSMGSCMIPTQQFVPTGILTQEKKYVGEVM